MNNVNNLRKIIEIFRKDVSYDNIKIKKKHRVSPLFRRYKLQKTTGGSQIDPPVVLGLCYIFLHVLCYKFF